MIIENITNNNIQRLIRFSAILTKDNLTNSNFMSYKFEEKYNLAKKIWRKVQFGKKNMTKSTI